MAEAPSNFRAFWPHYLMAHRNPVSRRLHFIGTTGALLALALAIIHTDPLWLLAGVIFIYGFAWSGHFFVEHNRPATFRHPFWSFIGDFKMYTLWMLGGLEEELEAVERNFVTGPTP